MTITLDIIDHVATLARLDLTDDEKQRYATQLSGIFDYIALLDEVDTDNVEETCQVTGLKNVFADDVVEEVSDEERRALLDAFPQKLGNLLKVKAVFDKK